MKHTQAGVCGGRGSYDGAVIGELFQIGPAPTLLTRTPSAAPIGFTRLRSGSGEVRARDVPYETAYSVHIGLAFHAHITEAYGVDAPPQHRLIGHLAPFQLRRAIDHMLAHLDGDPAVAELAKLCGLSPSYFARAFRRTTGITPHQWLVRRRVEQARQMLLGGRMELAPIALACGFVDQSHFTRVFARIAGESPGRWRRRYS